MFNSKQNTNSHNRISSYDSGKASIIVKPKVKPPLRSSSLYNPYSQEVFHLQQKINNHKPIEEFEEVELVADNDTASSSSSTSSSDDDELSLSAAEIAASVRSSRIITISNTEPQPINQKKKKKQNRLSRMVFGWAKKQSKVATYYDDGREELIYRGIQVKELTTTLDPIILTNPMPQPQHLQRPEFARLNY